MSMCGSCSSGWTSADHTDCDDTVGTGNSVHPGAGWHTTAKADGGWDYDCSNNVELGPEFDNHTGCDTATCTTVPMRQTANPQRLCGKDLVFEGCSLLGTTCSVSGGRDTGKVTCR